VRKALVVAATAKGRKEERNLFIKAYAISVVDHHWLVVFGFELAHAD